MIATYDSTCPACGDDIVREIDEITLTDDGWVHGDCVPEDPEPVTFPL
jgi:hypothetical protein